MSNPLDSVQIKVLETVSMDRSFPVWADFCCQRIDCFIWPFTHVGNQQSALNWRVVGINDKSFHSVFVPNQQLWVGYALTCERSTKIVKNRQEKWKQLKTLGNTWNMWKHVQENMPKSNYKKYKKMYKAVTITLNDT